MSDWELSAEYQDYLSGRISKRESIEKYHRRKEELEVRKDCEKCMRGCAPRWLFCWPCAGLCFEESKKNGSGKDVVVPRHYLACSTVE